MKEPPIKLMHTTTRLEYSITHVTVTTKSVCHGIIISDVCGNQNDVLSELCTLAVALYTYSNSPITLYHLHACTVNINSFLSDSVNSSIV